MKILEAGHIYKIPCRYNQCEQIIQFVKLKDGELVYGGLFGQDLMEVLIDRLNFQIKNDTDDDKEYRKKILKHVENALQEFNDFTEWRKINGKYHK